MDIDECSAEVGSGLKHCGSNADCSNTVGSFSCSCHSGFENFTPTIGCVDIDECSSGTHTCKRAAKCNNTAGGFTCTCWDGYDGDPHVNCYDIDECAIGGKYACTFTEHSGVPDMACVNLPGSYGCVDATIRLAPRTRHFFVLMGLNRDFYKV